MLKHETITLKGRDAGLKVRLTELPALLADRAARAALKALGQEPAGGIVSLALEHLQAARTAQVTGAVDLQAFVQADWTDESGHMHALDMRKLSDWRSIEQIQNAALLLHISFLIGRETLEVPVSFQAAQILSKTADVRATWCSPQIAGVLSAKLASYRELETVLSVEDVYNLCEILNVDALRDFQATQVK